MCWMDHAMKKHNKESDIVKCKTRLSLVRRPTRTLHDVTHGGCNLPTRPLRADFKFTSKNVHT